MVDPYWAQPRMWLNVLDSIVVSIPACHAGDPGSIPGRRDYFAKLMLYIVQKHLFNPLQYS